MHGAVFLSTHSSTWLGAWLGTGANLPFILEQFNDFDVTNG
jgi:hypothetical protein